MDGFSADGQTKSLILCLFQNSGRFHGDMHLFYRKELKIQPVFFFFKNSHLNVNCTHRDSITQNPLQFEIPAVNSVLHYSTNLLPPPMAVML